jgi:hypothetical protein
MPLVIQSYSFEWCGKQAQMRRGDFARVQGKLETFERWDGKKMRSGITFIVTLITGLTAVTTLSAQGLYIYPAKGQSQDQLNRDRYECHSWAAQQTGYDPTRGPVGTPPQQQPQQGGLLRGAGRGAAVGAVGGAIGGDAGKGAAIGAATGALFGGMRRRQQQRNQQAAQQRYQAQQQSAINEYNRAMGACLTGRGYQVR